jgi:tetratricopeptide (TPR) repeat protein
LAIVVVFGTAIGTSDPPSGFDPARLNLALAYARADRVDVARSIAKGDPAVIAAIDQEMADKETIKRTERAERDAANSRASVEQLNAARISWSAGDLLGAESELRSLLGGPADKPARALLGRILVQTQRAFAACQLMKSVDLDGEGMAALAHALNRTSQPVEAAVMAARATTLAPESAYAWAVYAEALFLSGRADEAREAEDRALTIAEAVDDAYVHLTNALYFETDPTTRVQEQDAARSLEPANLTLGGEELRSLAGTGVLPSWVDLVASAPEDGSDAHERADTAAGELSLALLDPETRWDAYAQISWVYRRLGLNQRGDAWLMQALRDHPDAPEAYLLNMGASRNDPSTVILAQGLLELDPKNATATWIMAGATQ